MQAKELLSYLEKQDVKLWVKENGKLGYSAPKGVLTQKLFNDLAEHKSEIIAVMEKQRKAYVPIPSVSRKDMPDLSFSQKRLWFLDKLEVQSHTYNILLCLKAMGNIHLQALEKSLNQIIGRHEVLRTVFREAEGDDKEPFQVILPELNIKPRLTDLSGIPEDARDKSVRKAAYEEAVTPFDLSKGPLIRLNVIRSGKEEHVLLFNIHHIVFDVWSIHLFLKELSIFYKEIVSGIPSVVAALEIQYADFSEWQKKRLEGEAGEDHLRFWKEHLQGVPPFTELPTDRPRPSVQTFAGARRHFEIDAELSDRIKHLSGENNTTLFMTLYAVFAVQLFRYTGKKDIVTGTPVANRNHKQLEPLIGFFLNTLALRFRLTEDLSFTDLLNHVKENVLKAHRHQEFPFEKLVDELKTERSLSHNPLFQVMFVFQDISFEGLDLPGLSCSPFDFGFCVSRFDLTLHTRDVGGKLGGFFEYNTDLFDSSTIDRMIGHFQTLIESVVKNPSEKISRLQLLTPAEQHRILVEFNDTKADYPKDKCIHQLFEEQVEKTPDAVAVVFEDKKLTYNELNAKSNQLARYLRSMGVVSGVPVGICVERSIEMIAGMLGILKAGGAYVPMDPAYPSDRIIFYFRDAGIEILLTQKKLWQRFADNDSLKTTIYLDNNIECVKEECIENPSGNVTSRDIAYILYTSGSTGKPKGVAIEHHSPCALICWGQDIYSKDELSGMLASTSICFDLSVYEIFLTLCSGGKLILVQNALQLSETEKREEVTLINTVPSVAKQLVQTNGISETVQTVNLAGETLEQSLVDRLYEADHVKKVYDLYGPSEDTTYSTFTLRKKGGFYTIGKPIHNTQVYILDKNLFPVPTGVSGELHLSGKGLARGYFNRPEFTSEKFIPNPFGGAPNSRLYKTGDLASWFPDGNIKYSGRIDFQVKVRGFRIELGEIQTVLSKHPFVKESVVVATEDKTGDKHLTAYIEQNETYDSESEDMSAELKRHLDRKLPDYMIPAFFVFMDALPLTPNGKIDRKSLPEPDRKTSANAYVAPRNTMEMLLVKLWEEILEISPVGISDDFFEVGGHSLLAVKLISGINRKFNSDIPLSALFQSKTIESLAAVLDRDAAAPEYTPLVLLQPRGEKRPLFCVHAAGGNVFRFVRLASDMGTDRPFYGLQARGLESGELPYSSIEEMAAAYVEAIKSVQRTGPYLLSGWSLGGTVAYEMALILEKLGESVPAVIMIDAPSPFMDTYEEDDIEFMLERLKPAADMAFEDIDKQDSKQAKLLYIFNEMKLSGLLSPYISPEVAERHLKLHKYHNKILCQYRPSGRISSDIIFFKPTEKIPFDTKMKDPSDWKGFTTGKMEFYEVSGNHFNMLSDIHTPNLAKTFKICIDELKA